MRATCSRRTSTAAEQAPERYAFALERAGADRALALLVADPDATLEARRPRAAREAVEVDGRQAAGAGRARAARGRARARASSLPAARLAAGAVSLARGAHRSLELDDAALEVTRDARAAVDGRRARARARAARRCSRIPLPEGAADLRFGSDAPRARARAASRRAGSRVLRPARRPARRAIELALPARRRRSRRRASRARSRRARPSSRCSSPTPAGSRRSSERLHRRRPLRTNDRTYLHLEAFEVAPGESVGARARAAAAARPRAARALALGFVLAAALGAAWLLTRPLREARAAAARAPQAEAELSATRASARRSTRRSATSSTTSRRASSTAEDHARLARRAARARGRAAGAGARCGAEPLRAGRQAPVPPGAQRAERAKEPLLCVRRHRRPRAHRFCAQLRRRARRAARRCVSVALARARAREALRPARRAAPARPRASPAGARARRARPERRRQVHAAAAARRARAPERRAALDASRREARAIGARARARSVGLVGHATLPLRRRSPRARTCCFAARLYGVADPAARAARAARGASELEPSPSGARARSRAASRSASRSRARCVHDPQLVLLDEPFDGPRRARRRAPRGAARGGAARRARRWSSSRHDLARVARLADGRSCWRGGRAAQLERRRAARRRRARRAAAEAAARGARPVNVLLAVLWKDLVIGVAQPRPARRDGRVRAARGDRASSSPRRPAPGPRRAPTCPGLLWVAYLFAACSGLNRAFALELENDALSPASRSRPWTAAGSSSARPLASFAAPARGRRPSTAVAFALAFDLDLWRRGAAGSPLVAALGAARALLASGTLFAAIAVRTRYREVMLPLLLLPLLVPVLLGAVRATTRLLARAARCPGRALQLLLVTDAVFLIVSLPDLRVRARRVRRRAATPAAATPDRRALLAPRCAALWAAGSSWRAPVDSMQGVIQKILYVHVPCAFAAYLGFALHGARRRALPAGGATSAATGSRGLAAEVGVLFCTLVIAHRADLGARAPGAAGGRGTCASRSRCCSTSSTSRTCCCAASRRAASARRASPRSTAIAGLARDPAQLLRDRPGRRAARSTPRTSSAGSLGRRDGRALRARSARRRSWPLRTSSCDASRSAWLRERARPHRGRSGAEGRRELRGRGLRAGDRGACSPTRAAPRACATAPRARGPGSAPGQIAVDSIGQHGKYKLRCS